MIGMIGRGLRIAGAFIRRDFLLQISYKAIFAGQLVLIFVVSGILYFAADVFQGAPAARVEAYGGNYFAFLLIGVAFTDYLNVSLAAFNRNIQESQLMGTLELLILSPYAFSTLLICSSLWPALFTAFRFCLYLLCGFALGVNLGQASVGAAVLVMVLSALSFATIGVLVSSVTLVFKRGVPMNVLIGGVSVFLGGAVYPVSSLPPWMVRLSAWVPLTHSLEAMRRAVLKGEGIAQLWRELLALTVFSALLLPLGLWLVHLAVKRTKVSGTVAHY